MGIGNWKEKITQYMEIRLNLLKLGFIERISSILGFLVFIFMGIFLSASVLFFIGMGVGAYFGELLHSTSGGFFITGSFFVLLLLIVFLLRTAIIHSFMSLFIRVMTAIPDEEDDEKPAGKAKAGAGDQG